MELPTHVLLMYGYLLLFAWVLVGLLGIPLPATPVLLAAGALSADGPISFPAGIRSQPRRRAHRRQRVVPHRAQLWVPCAAPSLQAVAGANHMCPPHPGFLWQAPRPPVDLCQVHSRARNSHRPGCRAERHADRAIPPLRLHRLRFVGECVAGRGPLLRRPAQTQSLPAQLGRPLLRRAAAPGHCRLFPDSRLAPPHGAQEVLPPRASSPKS